jgi:methionyl-tRNA synthetase
MMSNKSQRLTTATAYLIRAMFLSVMVASPVLPFAATQAFGLIGLDNSAKSAGAGLVLWMSLQR